MSGSGRTAAGAANSRRGWKAKPDPGQKASDQQTGTVELAEATLFKPASLDYAERAAASPDRTSTMAAACRLP